MSWGDVVFGVGKTREKLRSERAEVLADLGGLDFLFYAVVSGGAWEKFLERGESHCNNLDVFSAMSAQEKVEAWARPD